MADEITSKVYSATNADDDHKLHELSVRMHELAIDIKGATSTRELAGNADELADTVLEFLRVAGWSRS